MAIDCNDLWRLASDLTRLANDPQIHPGSVEPIRRMAIGRYYYAAYHRALSYASDCGYDPPGEHEGGSHSSLWLWYVNRGGSFALAGNVGFAMHRRRKDADYRLGEECPSIDDQREEGILFGQKMDDFEADLYGEPEAGAPDMPA